MRVAVRPGITAGSIGGLVWTRFVVSAWQGRYDG